VDETIWSHFHYYKNLIDYCLILSTTRFADARWIFVIVLNKIQVSLAHQTKPQDILMFQQMSLRIKGVHCMDKRTGKKKKQVKQPKVEEAISSTERLSVVSPKQTNTPKKK
jgi:hypothetical protein